MFENETRLKAYKEEIEVITLSIVVPEYEGERRNYFYKYEDVLLKLFNNKREDKDILEIENYYGSNKITIRVNLTRYLEDSYKERDEAIEHLKTWLTSGLDLSNEQVETSFNKGYIYEVDSYDNKIDDFDKNDDRIYNYLEWVD